VYTVAEVVPSGWTQTNPVANERVVLDDFDDGNISEYVQYGSTSVSVTAGRRITGHTA